MLGPDSGAGEYMVGGSVARQDEFVGDSLELERGIDLLE